MKNKKSHISRKEFIKKSSAGIIGAGLIANQPLYLWGNQSKQAKMFWVKPD